MKGNGIARITELVVNISFSPRPTVGKKKKQTNKLDKRNHVSRASPKKNLVDSSHLTLALNRKLHFSAFKL